MELFPPGDDLQSRLTASLKGMLVEEIRAPEYLYRWRWWPVAGGPPVPALRARQRKVKVAGWPTPDTSARGADTAPPGNWTRPSGANRASTLQRTAHMVELGGWPSPMAGSPATEAYNAAWNTDSSRRTVELLAGWSTPQANEPDSEERPSRAETGRTTEYLGRCRGWLGGQRQGQRTAARPRRATTAAT